MADTIEALGSGETALPPVSELVGREFPGLSAAGKVYLLARLNEPLVIITTADRVELFTSLKAFGRSVTLRPTLAEWHVLEYPVVLGLRDALAPLPRNPDQLVLRLRLGQEMPREALLSRLEHMGYTRALGGEQAPGSYVVRGGVLDVQFGASLYRLEFFGDALDAVQEIRNGVVSRHHQVALPPLVAPQADSTVLAELSGVVALDMPELWVGELEEAETYWLHQLWNYLKSRRVISLGRSPLDLLPGELPLGSLAFYRGRLEKLRSDVTRWLREGYSLAIILQHRRSLEYLRRKVLSWAPYVDVPQVQALPGQVQLLEGHLSGGFVDEAARLVVMGEDLVFGYQEVRRRGRLPGRALANPQALRMGDHLIHPEHGVGQFEGLEARTVLGVTRDYVLLRYSGQGRLYLPVDQLPLLRRYQGAEGEEVPLGTLGSGEWRRAKERARASAEELARKLIAIYAARQLQPGYAFPLESEWDRQLAASFPFT
ncbi:MAG: transcription-repair coupling factor, partial [Deinococcus sp.]|nr:transcription-repair coupling factor [Deinococcus sp.]